MYTDPVQMLAIRVMWGYIYRWSLVNALEVASISVVSHFKICLHVLFTFRYGPPVRTDYRVVVENLSSRVSWQVSLET